MKLKLSWIPTVESEIQLKFETLYHEILSISDDKEMTERIVKYSKSYPDQIKFMKYAKHELLKGNNLIPPTTLEGIPMQPGLDP